MNWQQIRNFCYITHQKGLLFACLGLVSLSWLLVYPSTAQSRSLNPALNSLNKLPLKNLVIEVRQITENVTQTEATANTTPSIVIHSSGQVTGPTSAAWSTRSQQGQKAAIQRVSVLNGQTGRIRLAQTMPLQWWQVWLTPQGPQAAPTTLFTEAGVGFQVRPSWVDGSTQVRVEIETESSPGLDTTPADPTLPTRLTTLTTIDIPLGLWVTIANSQSQQRHAQTTDVDSGQRWSTQGSVDQKQQQFVQIRVLLP